MCATSQGRRDGLLERRKQKREKRGCEWLREREGRRQGRRERDIEVGMNQSGGEDRPRRKRSIVMLIGIRV